MSTDAPTVGTRQSGRPRDQQIDTAILAATLSLLAESGYLALSLEEVARRAGTTRPAIYRRWAGRPHLVLAAIADRLDIPEPPDTGCTLCDIDEGLRVFLAEFRTIRPDVLASLYADCAPDPDLRSQYTRIVFDPPRAAVGSMLDRAISRGDLRRDTDREQLVDLLGALVYYRALFGREHLSDAEAERVVETLLRGTAVNYDALLAHSRSLELASSTPVAGTHMLH